MWKVQMTRPFWAYIAFQVVSFCSELGLSYCKYWRWFLLLCSILINWNFLSMERRAFSNLRFLWFIYLCFLQHPSFHHPCCETTYRFRIHLKLFFLFFRWSTLDGRWYEFWPNSYRWKHIQKVLLLLQRILQWKLPTNISVRLRIKASSTASATYSTASSTTTTSSFEQSMYGDQNLAQWSAGVTKIPSCLFVIR